MRTSRFARRHCVRSAFSRCVRSRQTSRGRGGDTLSQRAQAAPRGALPSALERAFPPAHPCTRPQSSIAESLGRHAPQQLKHDNIVNLIEVFRRKSKLHLVFEYVERTILEDLERNPDGMDPIETKKCLWRRLSSSLVSCGRGGGLPLHRRSICEGPDWLLFVSTCTTVRLLHVDGNPHSKGRKNGLQQVQPRRTSDKGRVVRDDVSSSRER